jgi:O-antigen ligase
MTVAATTLSPPSSPVDWRGALFFAILAVAWISFAPFPDLSVKDPTELSQGNDFWVYAAFAAIAAIAAPAIWRTDQPALRSLATPSYIALAGWIGVTCITSQDPAISIKRAALLGSVVVCTAALFLLPRDRKQLASLLCWIALLILALCYVGVVFFPQYAIHQATDLSEPQLAGDWRGLFGHKNAASAIFSVLAFVGLFVRSERRHVGWAIFALSIAFVVASGGKSSIMNCSITIVVSLLAARMKNIALWAAIVFSPLVAMNLFGVGSVLWPFLADYSGLLPLDSSFTGRTDVWSFALPKAKEALVMGHGFLAFWNTEALRYGIDQSTTWAGGAAHAHNGYLDAVISMGLPGLFLVLVAFVIKPARDLRRGLAENDEPALVLLFMRIWLFSLFLNSFESFFFDRANPSWIALLFALFGAHYLARFRITREAAADRL